TLWPVVAGRGEADWDDSWRHDRTTVAGQSAVRLPVVSAAGGPLRWLGRRGEGESGSGSWLSEEASTHWIPNPNPRLKRERAPVGVRAASCDSGDAKVGRTEAMADRG
ncbi:hypothetical protein V8G54_027765, partial [Vigna mungo]